jgi:hypothetical protein
MKTLIKNPELKIDSKEDGVWLHFSTCDYHASINLPVAFNKMFPNTITETAMRRWCEAFARTSGRSADERK